MGIKGMQGVSAHVEYIGPKGRKSRKKCIFYKEGKCICTKSQSYLMKCVGRIYCGKYEDDILEAKKLEEEKRELLNYSYEASKNKKRIVKKKSKKQLGGLKLKNTKTVVNLSEEKRNNLYKTVKLRSLRMQEDIIVKIVRPSEENTFNRKYTIESNFGRALAGKKVGDIIKVNVFKGILEYKVLEITRE